MKAMSNFSFDKVMALEPTPRTRTIQKTPRPCRTGGNVLTCLVGNVTATTGLGHHDTKRFASALFEEDAHFRGSAHFHHLSSSAQHYPPHRLTRTPPPPHPLPRLSTSSRSYFRNQTLWVNEEEYAHYEFAHYQITHHRPTAQFCQNGTGGEGLPSGSHHHPFSPPPYTITSGSIFASLSSPHAARTPAMEFNFDLTLDQVAGAASARRNSPSPLAEHDSAAGTDASFAGFGDAKDASPTRRLASRPLSTTEPSNLRRSEGLFNLQLPHPPIPGHSGGHHAKLSRFSRGSGVRPASSGLKRPHPFGSSRASFLAAGSPSSMASTVTASPAITSKPKRPHIPLHSRAQLRGTAPFAPRNGPESGRLTPDASFRGAKPLLTAFTGPSGLQSKTRLDADSHALSPSSSSSLHPTASLLAPETPCKPLNTTPDLSNRQLNLGERMERFSLSHLEETAEFRGSPGTPTRADPNRSGVSTSTPLLASNPVLASRQVSDATTATPGTIRARRAPNSILDPLDSDDLGSLSMDSLSSPRSSPKTPELHQHQHQHQPQHTQMQLHASPQRRPHESPQRMRMMKPPSSTNGSVVSAPHALKTVTPNSSTQNLLSSNAPGTPAPRTPGHRQTAAAPALDLTLTQKFDHVAELGGGEFSTVFVVSKAKQRFAVKRNKKPGELRSQRARQRRQEEIALLRELSSDTDDERREYVVQLVEAWESQAFGYIMTEYCENGDLDRFLAEHGSISRLEEWRVWKIFAELAWGMSFIHAHDVLHLDLKPANVFITFEGQLKIGDFGMASKWPVAPGFEREGDREYIAPEVLERAEYGKPADVFSLGIMMVEIAANIVLPDNGIHWQRLRSGDLSDAGRLSSGDLRSISGLVESSRQTPPPWAPDFLVDDSRALDHLVEAMLRPDPSRRPTMLDLVETPQLTLVNARRQAGAIVYEGDYGPTPFDFEDEPTWRR